MPCHMARPAARRTRRSATPALQNRAASAAGIWSMKGCLSAISASRNRHTMHTHGRIRAIKASIGHSFRYKMAGAAPRSVPIIPKYQGYHRSRFCVTLCVRSGIDTMSASLSGPARRASEESSALGYTSRHSLARHCLRRHQLRAAQSFSNLSHREPASLQTGREMVSVRAVRIDSASS